MFTEQINRSISRALSRPLHRPMSGGTEAAPEPLLLDTYTGASIAYSLRKLRTAYAGACIRVRRSSDNTEQDIGFSSNTLNTGDLLSFCGAGNGFVTTWYDQSANANNATQATTTQQPQIVASGAMLTQGGLAAVRSIGQRLNFSAFSASDFSLFSVFKIDAASGWCSFIQNVGAAAGFKQISRQSPTWQPMLIPYANQSEVVANGRASTVNNSVPTARRLESWAFAPATHRANGSSVTVNSDVMAGWGNGVSAIGAMNYLGDSSSAVTTHLQECIVFPTNQSSNAAAIETDLNSYWGVY